MEPLQYTSKEMFSSTELIRKNKMIFDKLAKEEIDKAVILRDGKPSFMLLAFDQYEELMNDYIKLKSKSKNSHPEKTDQKIETKKYNDEITIEEEKIVSKEEIDEDELANALKEIEELNLDSEEEIEDNVQIKTTKKDKEPLKEFWE